MLRTIGFKARRRAGGGTHPQEPRDEALRLQRLFNEANLPVVFVKGAALAMLAFNNLGMRAGQDIHVLVPYETLPAAMTLVSRETLFRSSALNQ